MTTIETPVQADTETRDVPRAAFRQSFGSVEIIQAPEKSDPARKSIEMTALSGDVLGHWYWGRIVQDLSTMRHDSAIAIDWAHDHDEPIGRIEKFTVGDGLQLSGELISTHEGDKASWVISKGNAGIPFQASIEWDPYTANVSFLPEGITAQINGREIEGPCYIVTDWKLIGVAVCLHGADTGTATEFSKGAGSAQIGVHKMARKAADATKPDATSETAAATQQAVDVKPDVKPEATEPTPAVQTVDDFRSELARYTSRFGAADGAEYFQAGLSYTEALEKALDKQTAATQAAEKQATEAAERLASIQTGETSSVDTGKPGQANAKTFGEYARRK